MTALSGDVDRWLAGTKKRRFNRTKKLVSGTPGMTVPNEHAGSDRENETGPSVTNVPGLSVTNVPG